MTTKAILPEYIKDILKEIARTNNKPLDQVIYEYTKDEDIDQAIQKILFYIWDTVKETEKEPMKILKSLSEKAGLHITTLVKSNMKESLFFILEFNKKEKRDSKLHFADLKNGKADLTIQGNKHKIFSCFAIENACKKLSCEDAIRLLKTVI